jgi:hypothetical protein
MVKTWIRIPPGYKEVGKITALLLRILAELIDKIKIWAKKTIFITVAVDQG